MRVEWDKKTVSEAGIRKRRCLDFARCAECGQTRSCFGAFSASRV